jgi:hypothetical protein
VSHYIKAHAMPPYLFHVLNNLKQHILICPFYALTSFNSFVSFGLMKKYVFLSILETFLSFVCTSWYKRLGLGLKPHLVRGSNMICFCTTRQNFNIWPTTWTWIALVLQSHLLTFYLRHKHDFPWYPKGIFEHIIHVTNMGCFGTRKPSFNIFSTT